MTASRCRQLTPLAQLQAPNCRRGMSVEPKSLKAPVACSRGSGALLCETRASFYRQGRPAIASVCTGWKHRLLVRFEQAAREDVVPVAETDVAFILGHSSCRVESRLSVEECPDLWLRAHLLSCIPLRL